MSSSVENFHSRIKTGYFFLSSAEGDLTSPSVSLTTMDHGVQVVDLMQYTPLGGVLYYDAFHLPPQAHQVNGWEIRQVNRKGFQLQLLTPDPGDKVHLIQHYLNSWFFS